MHDSALAPSGRRGKRLSALLACLFACLLFFFSGCTPANRTQDMRKPENPALEQALPSGFIALSESRTNNYADAVAFCKRHGGRLPRINNSDSWDGRNPPARDIHIDGFGYGHRPWSEVGLPSAAYWTGTADTDNAGYSWFVSAYGGNVDVDSSHQSDGTSVVCVP